MIIAILLPSKIRKIKQTLSIIGFISLYVQSTPIFAYNLATSIEQKPISTNAPTPDAIVVLSGGVNNNGYEYPIKAIVNTDTLIRLRYAVYLAQKYPNATLILSGGYTGSRYKEAQVMKDTLDTMFNIENPIIVEDNSINTNENAKFTAKIIKLHHFQTIYLVTQAYHMKRSMMLFHENGVTPIAAPTDYTHSDDAMTKELMFIPTARAQSITSRSLHEIWGYYLYKLNYSIEGGKAQFLDYL